METQDSETSCLDKQCSYRTYEEWKLKKNSAIETGLNGFLPYLWGMETLETPKTAATSLPRSYRTYEEWKQFSIEPMIADYIFSFLPYLWGMETPFTYRLGPENDKVLTVPMRNGNILGGEKMPKAFIVLTVPMRNGNQGARGGTNLPEEEFLPYLWGMETTRDDMCKCFANPRSYRTYEEWKPRNSS